MSFDTESSLCSAMGQVFYSGLAGHLFTAQGTDKVDRISNTYFARGGEQTFEDSQECATEPPDSSIDSRLPTFSREEIMTRTETLRSQGIILLRDHSATMLPSIAPLECLRLQPPDLTLFEEWKMGMATERQRLAYMQLMLLVAYNWWSMLPTKLDEFYEALAGFRAQHGFHGNEASCWILALSLACSRGHKKVLLCLLRFFVPTIVDVNGSRCKPKLLRSEHGEQNLLDAIPSQGLERRKYSLYRGDSKLHLPPEILEQLRQYFVNTELLTTRTKPLVSPLEVALRLGDGMLSELFMSWLRPSGVSELVLPDGGASLDALLDSAFQGRLITSAKYLVETGAKASEGMLKDSGEVYLRRICEDDFVSPEEALEWAKLLHGLGEDLFARRHDGRTLLHLAAANGKGSVVRYIIAQTRSRQQRHPKDEAERTPLMLADSVEVMNEFAPWQPNSDGDVAETVCGRYYATVMTTQWLEYSWDIPLSPSLLGLLYEEGGSDYFGRKGDEPVRWIHLPANNIEWCEDLLLRWLLERDGVFDTQKFEAAQQAFNQQHTSRTPQGRFFRPGVYCTQPSNHIVFIAAPYMDFETSCNIEKMQRALQISADPHRLIASDSTSPGQDLYKTYISSAALHPRRTLDQYMYYNMDTSDRDIDQVVQRYQRAQLAQANRAGVGSDGHAPQISLDEGKEETAIMVDQLWMWILGDGLIVTCGAERWNAPKPIFRSKYNHAIVHRLRNSFNSLDHGRHPCRATAGDAAIQFMMACFGTFDRHARGTTNLQFMSMFEQSIGAIGAKDSDLLREFSTAYTALKTNKGVSRETFVMALKDLTTETDLLTELKDIRDELHIMNTILLDQQRVARSLLNLQMKVIRNHRTSLFSPIEVESARPEADQEELFEPVETIINQGLQDIAQMDAQAKRLSGSLSELLQLKQAHYNAFELEFSRDLALKAASQGRAVLVFTVVTIVFSPLSFVAAFFTMNLTIFPEKLSLSYVSRYVFGLGFAVAIPCIVLAFSLGWTSSWKRVKVALSSAFPESTVGRAAGDALEKDASLGVPAHAGSTQAMNPLSNRSSTAIRSNKERPSANLGGVGSHETPKVTAGLKRRWRSWRTPEATLPV